MSSQNSAWFFRHQVYNKLSNNQTQIELKLCPNHEGILFYVSTICQKKKIFKNTYTTQASNLLLQAISISLSFILDSKHKSL